jgi:hypothetical protein
MNGDFGGPGVMTIQLNSFVRRIVQIFVLGCICCTGTAVLLDETNNIWFYNVPDAVDPYLGGTVSQTASISIPSLGVSKYAELVFDAGPGTIRVDDYSGF